MTVVDPAALTPDQVANLCAVSRVLEEGGAGLLNSRGERVDLPPSVQELLRTVVLLMESGQKVTLFPALADREAMERIEALDDLAREAHALGLYDRDEPGEAQAEE